MSFEEKLNLEWLCTVNAGEGLVIVNMPENYTTENKKAVFLRDK